MTDRAKPDQFFLVTYGPVKRVHCCACDKSAHLVDEPGAYQALCDSHRCGPRTSPWDSPGLNP